MSQAILTTDKLLNEPEVLPSRIATTRLRDTVTESVRHYLIQFEQPPLTNLYELVLAEVETPMLEIVLQYVNHNQSRTARLLKMSRGTLRKKMQQYGLLTQSNKRKAKRL